MFLEANELFFVSHRLMSSSKYGLIYIARAWEYSVFLILVALINYEIL